MRPTSLARRSWLAAAAGTALEIAASRPSQAAALKPLAEVGKPAPPFDVPDAEGRHRTLAALHGKLVVLEWSSPTCPFASAQYLSGRMQALQQWSKQRGVVWYTVLSSHPSRED